MPSSLLKSQTYKAFLCCSYNYSRTSAVIVIKFDIGSSCMDQVNHTKFQTHTIHLALHILIQILIRGPTADN
jgi:hypothetical protein